MAVVGREEKAAALAPLSLVQWINWKKGRMYFDLRQVH